MPRPRPDVSVEFALAYAGMNQQQRDAAIDPRTGRPLVRVGQLEFACLATLASEVERLRRVCENE